MNYRHAYHAGNFADVVKHIVLMLCLDYMKQKDKGFCVLDAHGGCGLYDLAGIEAQKTREADEGVRRLAALADPPAALKPYLHMIKRDLAKDRYPGSPLIIARQLRAQDRLIATELHPDDHKTLKMVMGSHENVRIENRDAYEALRAHLPPPERRGLILIDPPFEQKDEFERLGRQMGEWARRFPTGTYLVWYPIKAHLPHALLDEAAAGNFAERLSVIALRYPPDRPESLNGAGLLILNPPYTLTATLASLLPALQEALGLYECRINHGAGQSGD